MYFFHHSRHTTDSLRKLPKKNQVIAVKESNEKNESEGGAAAEGRGTEGKTEDNPSTESEGKQRVEVQLQEETQLREEAKLQEKAVVVDDTPGSLRRHPKDIERHNGTGKKVNEKSGTEDGVAAKEGSKDGETEDILATEGKSE
jgi:hypothetical protein